MRNRKKNSANVTFNRKLTGTDNEGEEENRNKCIRVRTSFTKHTFEE